MGDVNFTTVKIDAWTPHKGVASPENHHAMLWGYAEDQAKLAYKTDKPTDEQIRTQLDQICDDNGFAHLDGTPGKTGQKNPNVVGANDPIKVRIDPTTGEPTAPPVPKGVKPEATAAFTDATKGGADLKALTDMPSFQALDGPTQKQVIDTYVAAKGDTNKQSDIAKLVSSDQFKTADAETKTTMLKYPSLANDPGVQAMPADQKKAFFKQYDGDTKFRDAIDKIMKSKAFGELSPQNKGKALNQLREFTTRPKGYQQQGDKKENILLNLWGDCMGRTGFYGEGDTKNNKEIARFGDQVVGESGSGDHKDRGEYNHDASYGAKDSNGWRGSHNLYE